VFLDGDAKGFHECAFLQAIEVYTRRWLVHAQDICASVQSNIAATMTLATAPEREKDLHECSDVPRLPGYCSIAAANCILLMNKSDGRWVF
jgi:hypothetical protein